MECEYFIIGSDRDASTWYLKAFPNWKLDLSDSYPEGGNMNATELRKRWSQIIMVLSGLTIFHSRNCLKVLARLCKLMCGDKGKIW